MRRTNNTRCPGTARSSISHPRTTAASSMRSASPGIFCRRTMTISRKTGARCGTGQCGWRGRRSNRARSDGCGSSRHGDSRRRTTAGRVILQRCGRPSQIVPLGGFASARIGGGGVRMDSTTLLIVIVLLVLLLGGGGGYYGRRSGWGGPHYGGGLLGLIILILLLLWLTGNLGGPGRLRPRVDRMTSVTDVRT